MNNFALLIGLLLPFFGTSLGAMGVFFIKKNTNNGIQKILLSFASGIMLAAAIFSLIIPSLEIANNTLKSSLTWLPAVVGFFLGILFLLLLDKIISKMQHLKEKTKKNSLMLVLSITIHNFPEGMAIGVALAGLLNASKDVTLASVFTLIIGIAIQNIPEGAIVSTPLLNDKKSRLKSFGYGVLSGIVEPIGAFLTLLLTNIFSLILPYVLSFAAGAMFYVVINELIPESFDDKKNYLNTIFLTLGFLIMLILDVALG